MELFCDLYRDILIRLLSQQEVKVTFENLDIANPNEMIEKTCFQALQKIRQVLDNDELQDFECIDQIITILEDVGANGGSRHDFG